MKRVLFSLAVLALVLPSPSSTLLAAPLNPGDFVLVSWPTSGGPPSLIVRLDHGSLTPSFISNGPLVTHASHVTVDGRGRILVTDIYSGVVVVNPATGDQSVLASVSTLGGKPSGIATSHDGNLFVSLTSPGRILRLNPDTGTPSVVSTGNLLDTPAALAIASDGQIYVAENRAPLRGSVVRVDPASGAQALVSSDATQFIYPFDIAVANGEAWTLQRGFNDGRGGCFVKTRLSDGVSARSEISSYCRSQGIAIAEDGTIAYSDCIPENIVCGTRFTARVPGPGLQLGLGGPLCAVPAGITTTTTTSWGRLKTIYR